MTNNKEGVFDTCGEKYPCAGCELDRARLIDQVPDKAKLTDKEIARAYFGFKTVTKIERAVADTATVKAYQAGQESMDAKLQAIVEIATQYLKANATLSTHTNQ